MKRQVLHPPKTDYAGRVLEGYCPLVFLAGPIQGAPDWQSRAIDLMPEEDWVVANPRTNPPWHGDYEGQVDWETRHLAYAARYGCVMFWLCREAEHRCDRAFGQTSRFELGEWFGRSMAEYTANSRLVVGIEPGFTNERYIRRRFDTCGYRFVIPDTLEATVDLAVRTAKVV